MFIIFLVACLIVGYGLCRFFDSRQNLGGLSLISASLMLGLTGLGYLVLLISLLIGQMVLATFLVLGLAGLGLIVFYQPIKKWFKDSWPSIKKENCLDWWEYLIIIGGLALFFLVSFQSMLWEDKISSPFSILKGWGDGAYHLGMVQRFIQAEPFTLDQPALANHPLTYPFFINFLTALFVDLGMPLSLAWHLPTFIFGLGMLVLAWRWASQFFNKKILAYAFVFLVVSGAGLGFLWLVKNVISSTPELGLVGSLEKYFNGSALEYSHLDVRTGGKPGAGHYPANIVWVVPLISFFSHQRSFVLGAGLGFLLLYGLGYYFFQKDSRWPRWLILFSFLPLMHLHSFMALAIFISVWLIGQWPKVKQFSFKELVIWSGITLVLALPSLWWLAKGVIQDAGNASFFLRPWFGWLMCTHTHSWLWCDQNVADTTLNVWWFWLKNFGLVFVAWLASLLINGLRVKELRAGELKIKGLLWPSVVLFILPNLFLFQPWEFDNNKIIFWWWVIAILFSLSLFDTLPAQSQSRAKVSPHFLFKKQFVISNLLLAAFIFFASASGVFDIFQRARWGWKIQPNLKNFSYYGSLGQELGQAIKELTRPNDIILTSQAPNQPVLLIGGRPLYLGYPGWLWTQGKRTILNDRQKIVKDFLQTGQTRKLCQEGVSYWVADERFFESYPVGPVDAVWSNTVLVKTIQDNNNSLELRKFVCLP